MAIKHINIPDIGDVRLSKRKGTKRLKLRISHSGDIIVSLPSWLPFMAGEKFASNHRDWIAKHRVAPKFLLPLRQVGKTHKLQFITTNSVNPTVKVDEQYVTVRVPSGIPITASTVQQAAQRGIHKALKLQESILNQRLLDISRSTGLKYNSARYTFMKSRWGSCRNDKTITLNYHLLDLRDELIEYVIIHELAHTKHMNHGPKFWMLVENFLPEYQARRKLIKRTSPSW